MSAALWLVRRDLTRRLSGAMVVALLVAAGAALFTGIELASRHHARDVQLTVARMGPPLRIVGAGVTLVELARGTDGALLSTVDAEALADGLSSWAHSVTARVTTRLEVEGQWAPLVGVDTAREAGLPPGLAALRAGQVAIGAALAETTDLALGDRLSTPAGMATVAAVLPHAGTSEDAAVFGVLSWLMAEPNLRGRVSEIRVFPRRVDALPAILRWVEHHRPDLSIIIDDQSLETLGQLERGLAADRWALFVGVGVVLTLVSLLGSWSDARQRRAELITLAALGAPKGLVAATLTLRGAAVAVAGALVGASASAVVASQAQRLAVEDLSMAMLGAVAVAAAAGVVGALPAALWSVRRERLLALAQHGAVT